MLACILDTLSNYLTLHFYSHRVQALHKYCTLGVWLLSVSSNKEERNNKKTKPTLLPEKQLNTTATIPAKGTR